MFPLLVFLIPLAVRAVPEILMSPYIVGFDPVGYYVPTILRWLREGVSFWEYMATAPLLDTVLMQLASLGVPLTLSLKIIPPILHGFLALAIYFFAYKAMTWSNRKSLLVALLATLYFVGLRVSWDMLKNELGLVFLFVALILLQDGKKFWKHYGLLSLAMSLLVLAHPFVAVIMFVIIAITIVRMLLDFRYGEARSLTLTSIPATLLFLLIVYARYVMNYSVIGVFSARESEGWLSLFGFASYQDMVVNTLSFLLYCYLPLLPLVIVGSRRLNNLPIKLWVLWSLVAILSPIISPNAFIPGLWRWTLMLVYPFAFYATEALACLKAKTRLIIGLILVALTLGFVVMPSESPFPYYALYPYYVPSSMLQNTVPLRDCQDTVDELRWLGSNMHGDARLLAHTAFYGWALLVLDEDRVISYGYGSPGKAAQEALQGGHDQLYLIWWTDGDGWHGQPTVPSSFKEVHRSGRIAIYNYAQTD